MRDAAYQSGDVGGSAHSAMLHSIGNVPSMTAMMLGIVTAGVYMPFSALALVEIAQTAIKTIATASRLDLVVPENSALGPHHFVERFQ